MKFVEFTASDNGGDYKIMINIAHIECFYQNEVNKNITILYMAGQDDFLTLREPYEEVKKKVLVLDN